MASNTAISEKPVPLFDHPHSKETGRQNISASMKNYVLYHNRTSPEEC